MKNILLLLLINICGFTLAQEPVSVGSKLPSKTTEARFPGGINAFQAAVYSSINTSDLPFENIKAQVFFTVDVDGSLADIKVNGINETLNKEIIISMKSIKTKWEPAKNKDKPVKSRFNMPMIFMGAMDEKG